MKTEWENENKESKEGMRLSHVFLIVLTVHMLVIGGAFAFQYWRSDSGERLSETNSKILKKSVLPEAPLVEKQTEVAQLPVEVKPLTDAKAVTEAKESIKLPPPIVDNTKSVITQPVFYKVAKGDSLSKIAKLHKVAVADLIRWNALKGDVIHLGQNLKVALDKPSAPAANLPLVNVHEVVREVAASKVSTQPRMENYVVEKGDTLFRIAKKFGSKPQSILEANQLKDANKIGVGMKLKVPVETEVTKAEGSKRAIESSNVAMSEQ